jgi:hypothetical protein
MIAICGRHELLPCRARKIQRLKDFGLVMTQFDLHSRHASWRRHHNAQEMSSSMPRWSQQPGEREVVSQTQWMFRSRGLLMGRPGAQEMWFVRLSNAYLRRSLASYPVNENSSDTRGASSSHHSSFTPREQPPPRHNAPRPLTALYSTFHASKPSRNNFIPPS